MIRRDKWGAPVLDMRSVDGLVRMPAPRITKHRRRGARCPQALRKTCPTCKAEPGQWCRMDPKYGQEQGDLCAFLHQPRINLTGRWPKKETP